MNAYILIGILGGVSSIVSLLIAAPTLKSRVIHAIYGFLLTLVVGSSFLYNQSAEVALQQANNREEALKSEIDKLISIRGGAQSILDSRAYSSTTDIGENRGFILTSFAFLEKHREVFPESYDIAKLLITSGIKVTESAGSVGSDGYYDEKKRMGDGAQATYTGTQHIQGQALSEESK